MNERIKHVRKALGLSQEEFGERIGLSKFAISGYENGKRAVPDRSLSDICREFNVNEEWLRNSKGDMFIRTEESALSELIDNYKLDDFGARALLAYQKLSPANRSVIKDYILSIAASYGVEFAEESAPDVVIDGKLVADPDTAARLASYNEELDAEKRAMEKLSALPITKDA